MIYHMYIQHTAATNPSYYTNYLLILIDTSVKITRPIGKLQSHGFQVYLSSKSIVVIIGYSNIQLSTKLQFVFFFISVSLNCLSYSIALVTPAKRFYHIGHPAYVLDKNSLFLSVKQYKNQLWKKIEKIIESRSNIILYV